MGDFSLLSAFELPWDAQRHGQAAEHARSCEERAMLYGLIDGAEDDADTRRFRAFVQLDGFVYPYASLQRLSVVGGFNQWLYFLDDQYDDHPESHGDLEAIRGIMQRGVDLLCGAPLQVKPTPFERYSRAYRRELAALMPSGFFERFVKNVKEYLFEGSLVGLGHWLRRETLSVDSYIELRALDSGVYPVIDCVEIAADLSLPQEVLEGRELSQMVHAAVRHVALTNDVFSFEKETLQNGSTVNLVHVLRLRENRSIESAAQRAADIVNGYTRAFQSLERRLPRYEPQVEADVRAYVHGMKTWMRGNVDFSLQSQRFRSSTSPFKELTIPPAKSA
jgi:hypothetical protein